MVPSALLIHGLSSSPLGWWRVHHHLEHHMSWTVEKVSLLGHDRRGPTDDYSLDAYAADAHRPGPWDLVIGHSLGGAIATVLAAADPGWTRRLVLLDPVWFIPQDQLAAVAADQLGELEWTMHSLHAAKPHWHEKDLVAKIDAVSGVDPGAVGRTFADTAEWDIRDRAAALRTPTLVIGGDPEVYTMTEPDDVRAASEASGTITYEMIAGAGHSPHRDRPDATLAALDSWLERN